MVSLGEMSAYIPHKRGFAGYATRFVDPAVGFALGYNYLMKYLIVTPNNINAAGAVLQYWQGGREVNIGVWMIFFIAFGTFTLKYPISNPPPFQSSSSTFSGFGCSVNLSFGSPALRFSP